MAVAAAAVAGALRFSLSALLADVFDDLLGASKTALCENTRNYIRILEYPSSFILAATYMSSSMSSARCGSFGSYLPSLSSLSDSVTPSGMSSVVFTMCSGLGSIKYAYVYLYIQICFIYLK